MDKREQARIRKQRQRDKERDIGERDTQKRDILGRDIDSVTSWETIPLDDIKAVLPQDITCSIIGIGEHYGNTDQRLRRAYKYHLWHEANFIDGVHKDSKYRKYIT